MEYETKQAEPPRASGAFGKMLQQKSKFQAFIAVTALSAFILSIARAATAKSPGARTITWVIVASLKSLLILAYDIFTERKSSLRRFASKKASMVLNVLDPVFWLTAFILTIISTQGPSTTAGRALGGIIIVITLVSIPAAVALAVIFWREYKQLR
ncbi:hypothetical protein C1H76_0831 [Elsinoe australis]|uniref:Uncharacterized protein n=1 Tax=Elsinoe australis TaxID=40998 RepID=A0A4U7BE70_9PEZI|nr:hypothetical protein C1H76_0831 [Elsinoe australis]